MTTSSIPEDEEEEQMPRVDVVYENIENMPPLLKTYIKSLSKPKRKRGDEGTSSTSVGQCDLGSGSAVGDKGKRILGFTSLMTTSSIPEDEEEEQMPRVDVVYENIENMPPLLKTYIKSLSKPKRKRGDEDPLERSSAAKRIDFDDPSAP
ncbi:uncharacterized protein LOC131876457 [Cryptomeria japonica]|uniref:uncharacterized protein LOC131876457 n=1 Tax=Cryptomeria japonica TaxID=3369 RepID=UPI0027DA7C2C|nr:uncharacterized protein LOC131876457 [Cryptomeria japonica]